MIDLRQSHFYARYMASRGWIVAKIPPCSLLRSNSRIRSSIFVYIKKLPLIPFSVMKIQRSFLPDFCAVDRMAKEYKSILTIIEPGIITDRLSSEVVAIFKSHGYRQDRWPLLPTMSLQVNLRLNSTTLFRSFKKDARYSIRKAKKLCQVRLLDLGSTQKISQFHSSWKQYGKGFIPTLIELRQLLEAFGNKAFVLGVYGKNESLLAGTVILNSNSCAWYYYAFTSPVGRGLSAGYLAVWEALLEAKRRGCTLFDLEGIFDRSYRFLRRWQGFSRFKKKFGGKEVLYPGSFVRYRVPWLGLLS